MYKYLSISLQYIYLMTGIGDFFLCKLQIQLYCKITLNSVLFMCMGYIFFFDLCKDIQFIVCGNVFVNVLLGNMPFL